MEFVETRLLPLLVLLLAGYAAFGDPPAWSWVHVAGTALAAVVLARAIPEAPRVFAEPLTIKLGAFTTARLLLPILLGFTSLLALLVGAPVAVETGVMFSIALAVVSML
jgi:hypothetical protein